MNIKYWVDMVFFSFRRALYSAEVTYVSMVSVAKILFLLFNAVNVSR